jgi:uncharacterized protein
MLRNAPIRQQWVRPQGLVREQLSIVWHAGEPLTVPVAWYERAFSRVEEYRPPRLRIDHHFQTNGLLVNTAWLEFLRRTGAHIGLSLDGPADLHDARRKTRHGGGTHARAMQGLRRLRDDGIPVHVISVLTRASLDRADDMFDFYVDNGIDQVAFNLEEIDGSNTKSTLQFVGVEKLFRNFLRRFLKRMRDNPGRLALRELDGAMQVIGARGLHGRRAQDAEPMRILSIDLAGNVFTFSPELLGTRDDRYGDFCFGNLLTDTLDVIATNIARSRLLADIRAGIDACQRTCVWFEYCGGGSPCNKLGETGAVTTTETMFCRLMRQTLFDVVLEILETAMERCQGPGPLS